jgi:hypothetical protein
MIFFRTLRCEQEGEHLRQRVQTTTFQTRLEISEYAAAGLHDSHIVCGSSSGSNDWVVAGSDSVDVDNCELMFALLGHTTRENAVRRNRQ